MKLVRNSVKLIDLAEPGRKIEYAGKVCYKTQGNITDSSYVKFITNIIKSEHLSVIEHESRLFMFDEELYNNNWCNSFNEEHYFNISRENKKVFVSGNIRAWYNLLKDLDDDSDLFLKGLSTYLHQDYPYIFKDFDIHPKCKYGYEAEKECENLGPHKLYTFEIVGSRSFTHQIVRHRTLSFSQESQRYCVAGDTKLKFLDAHNKLTVEEFFNLKNSSKNGSWKKIKIEQLDENTGKLIFSPIDDIFFMGEKKVFELKTKFGYSLKCTKDHQIYTPKGYLKLEELNVGDLVYVNGKNLKTIQADEIISIEEIGVEKVYDISMANKNHNFIANGLVVHNCNYSGGKFNHSIRIIDSVMPPGTEDLIQEMENTYFRLIDEGMKPEDARQILPNCAASTIVVSGTLDNWKKYLHLRVDSHAQREIREISETIMHYLHLTKQDIGR